MNGRAKQTNNNKTKKIGGLVLRNSMCNGGVLQTPTGTMSSETSESGATKEQQNLEGGGEVIGGGNGGGGSLKKGPWTSAEDAILVEYVKKHGEGNWNAVQKHSGLFRCGKSCRLRWANHLRPNLKKGAFTAEEEQIIIELHAKLGNKWARMAAQVVPILTFFFVGLLAFLFY